MKPFIPMSPILSDTIPEGAEWGYQLKWDGYRTIAMVNQGQVELYSKRMLAKQNKYPDLVQALSKKQGTFLLDGEAVVMDRATQRPSFQKMQQRDKLTNSGLIKKASEREPVLYILFDLLQWGDEDLRHLPFRERFKKLQEVTGSWEPPFFVTELFEDGETLWNWVSENGWEGVISKRLSSPYRMGKEHRDWYKIKTAVRLEVNIVGILMKEGRVSSLVMRTKEGYYFGRISSGLNAKIKAELFSLPADKSMMEYFSALPEGLKGTNIRWLNEPLVSEVTGTEVTEDGVLRHPKLLSLGGTPL
jgi:bifunctional non-homologous end joining protein LigD